MLRIAEVEVVVHSLALAAEQAVHNTAVGAGWALAEAAPDKPLAVVVVVPWQPVAIGIGQVGQVLALVAELAVAAGHCWGLDTFLFSLCISCVYHNITPLPYDIGGLPFILNSCTSPYWVVNQKLPLPN